MMYDIHMHIIPGVDDGSWNMDMSERLLYMAYEQGIRKIIATPHSSAFLENDNKVEKEFFKLQERVSKLLPNLQLYFGCEIKCCRIEMDMIVERLKAHKIPTLNKTKYVLIEFSKSIGQEEALECVEKLIDNGYYSVLAHIERYNNFFKEDKFLEKLQHLGCLFQINVYSVYDEENETIKTNACYLIKEKKVTFLGSDAHRTIDRPPSVKYGLLYLYEHYEKEYINQIVFENARELLNMNDEEKING